MDNIYISVLVVLLAIWTIPWKIYAVWTAVKANQIRWFVALMILNTMSILEIFYIFKISKKTWGDVKQDFRKAWASITRKS